MIGVNLYAGQFGTGGKYGTTYVYPGNSYLDYYASKGMDVIRIPFDWERLQPIKDGALDAVEVGRIRAVVDHARTLGLQVVLDPHNFGYGFGEMVGGGTSNASFANFWGQVATAFRDYPNIIFGLMNEPHDQTATQWIGSANAAMSAIRAAGANQLVLVPGTYWDGAYSWVSGAYDRPNSDDNDTVIGEGVIDPVNNYAFEVHNYFDAKNSGTGPTVSDTKGIENLIEITAWAERTGHRLFMGEFGSEGTPLDLRALDNTLAYMDDHPVWMGATYWAGGPWIGNYRYSIEPNAKDANGNPIDRPQLGVLQRYDLDPTTNPAIAAGVVAAIDAGGPGYNDTVRQIAYAGDAPSSFLVGTSKVSKDASLITATKDDALYQTVRFGKAFGYDIPVANGVYAVDLRFTETYWTTAGKRVFDVVGENQTLLSHVDIVAATGDRREAYDVTATVTVTDGVLDLWFDSTVAGSADNATVAGIVIRKIGDAPPPGPANPINGTEAADTLNGTTAADIITGLGGNDVLNGNAGNDELVGGAGNDKLNGGTGIDKMTGGLGDDTYFVDNAGDLVIETAGQGNDTINADVSYVLPDNVEKLVLRTGAAIDGTGNALANRLEGNSAANSLSGADGNDVLAGKGGNDILTGGAGADAFLFDTALNAATNVDRIMDLVHGTDQLRLENAVFTAYLTTGALAANSFAFGTTASTPDVHILYDQASGSLRYDADGSGPAAATLFALLNPGEVLTASDIVIV